MRINQIIGVYVKVLSRRRDLKIRVVYVNFRRWGIRPWWDFGFNKLQTEVLEDFFDDARDLYGTDHSHSSLTSWANKGIDAIDFLDQPGLILTKSLGRNIAFYKRRYPVILILLFPHAAGFITVIAIGAEVSGQTFIIHFTLITPIRKNGDVQEDVFLPNV